MEKGKENNKYNNFEEFAKRKPELTVLTDHPLSAEQAQELFELDPFNFRFKLGPVFDILRHSETKTPMSILISGGWGTGKTSAMKWLDTLLEQWNKEKELEDMKVRTVWFYPWKYDNKEDVRRGIISEVIIKATYIRDPETKELKLDANKLKEGLKTMGLFAFNAAKDFASSLKIGLPGFGDLEGEFVNKIVEDYKEASHPEKVFFQEYEAALKTWVGKSLGKSERMVIFIDDLDRCMPDISLQVLEAIKLYLNIPNLIFVLGVDKDVIENLVVEHYKKLGLVKERKEIELDEEKEKREKADSKARQYLSKMFQVEIELSPSDEEINRFYNEQLNKIPWESKLTEDEHKTLFRKLILKYAKRNPRELNRYLNNALIAGIGAEIIKEKNGEDEPKYEQGLQLYFIRVILRGFTSISEMINTDSGRRFFKEWSDLVKEYKSKENKYIESKDKEESDVIKLIAERLKENEEYKDYIDLLQDIGLQELMDILFSKKLAEFSGLIPLVISLGAAESVAVAEAVNVTITQKDPATKDSIMVRDAIARVLNKEPLKVTSSDYENLYELDLSFSSFTDVKQLENLKNLKKLVLYDTQISDINPLSCLTNLQELHLDSTLIDKLDALAGLTNLQNLTLAKTKFVDVGPLADLRNLRGLNLNGTAINDITPLIRLNKLEWLILIQTHIYDIEPLKEFKNLEELFLDESEVYNLESIKDLTKLQILRLNETKILDIEPIRGLIGLRELFLHYTKVSNLEPLRNLTKLSRLGINNTLVTNIEPLKNINSLIALDLNNTQVSDIESLKNLKNLQRLYLMETKISDFSTLSYLTNLQLLDLVNTNIADLKPIKELKNLKEVRLLGCENITIEKIIDLQKSLPYCRILSGLKEDFLINNSFRLIFNPKSPKTKNKIMKFAKGGIITEGNNNNESSWRVKKGYLEFLNSEEKVHSRFYYNPVDKRFTHTNDKDTRSIREQYMVLIEES